MVKPAHRRCRPRQSVRRTWRRPAAHAGRRLHRSSVRNLPGHVRRPGELSQALAAFSRAIRCHRRLDRLAPRFFDPAVVDRDLAGLDCLLAVGSLHFERYQRVRPHDRPSLGRVLRLLEIGFDLLHLALGPDPAREPSPAPAHGLDFDQALAKIYGQT